MTTGYSRYIPFISFLGEVILLNTLFVAGFIVNQPTTGWHAESILFYLYINAAWFSISYFSRGFEVNRHAQWRKILTGTSTNIILFLFIFLVYFQIRSFNYFPRDEVKSIFIQFIVLLFLWKLALNGVFFYYRKLGYNFRKVLFIGMNDAVADLQHFMKMESWYGYKIMGFVGKSPDERMKYLGAFHQLDAIILRAEPDEVYIAYTSLSDDEKEILAEKLSHYKVQVNLIPDLGNFLYQKVEWRDLGIVPVMALHTGPLAFWGNRAIKRLFDIVFSLVVIVGLLSWVTILLYIVDFFTGKKGIWYVQKRTSVHGRTFSIFKFKSMIDNDQADVQQAVKNDPRITRIGALLRKTNLDEIPQFVNVLLGDMSVIGPRPHMLAHTEEYSRQVSRYMFRHTVKPGISGLAQVHGFRGEVKSMEDIRKRVEKDIEYIKRWSFWLDILIIWQTGWLLILESTGIKRIARTASKHKKNVVPKRHNR